MDYDLPSSVTRRRSFPIAVRRRRQQASNYWLAFRYISTTISKTPKPKQTGDGFQLAISTTVSLFPLEIEHRSGRGKQTAAIKSCWWTSAPIRSGKWEKKFNSVGGSVRNETVSQNRPWGWGWGWRGGFFFCFFLFRFEIRHTVSHPSSIAILLDPPSIFR